SHSNSECRTWIPGSETAGDKLRRREGNSPDRKLRSLSSGSVGKDVGLLRQPGCWLRSSHSFKECVIAHWSSGPASKIPGHQAWHRSFGLQLCCSGRRAFQRHRSRAAKRGGASGKENVGMSNDKMCEKHIRRKPKGFCSTLIGTELVGT